MSAKASDQKQDEQFEKDNLIVLNGAGTVLPPDNTEGDPERIRTRITYLKDTIDNAYFELARLLYQVWSGGDEGAPLYLKWGYGSFPEYVEKELDFALRKAQYLIRIWEWFGVQQSGDTSLIEKVRPIGWTKVKELVGVIQKENADEWVEKAKKMSAPELAQEAKAILKRNQEEAEKAADGEIDGSTEGAAPKPPKVEKLHHLSFSLYDGQLKTVQSALERAQELAQSDKKGHLLEMICTDWLATNDAMRGGKKANVSAYMHKFERLLGIRIIAIDVEQKEILCGADVAGLLDDAEDAEEAESEVEADEPDAMKVEGDSEDDVEPEDDGEVVV